MDDKMTTWNLDAAFGAMVASVLLAIPFRDQESHRVQPLPAGHRPRQRRWRGGKVAGWHAPAGLSIEIGYDPAADCLERYSSSNTIKIAPCLRLWSRAPSQPSTSKPRTARLRAGSSTQPSHRRDAPRRDQPLRGAMGIQNTHGPALRQLRIAIGTRVLLTSSEFGCRFSLVRRDAWSHTMPQEAGS